jgi:hypothetical protein
VTSASSLLPYLPLELLSTLGFDLTNAFSVLFPLFFCLRLLQAVEATKNVELGNKELTQAIQRNSSSRTFLMLFLFVLTFSIIFLDWYS